VVSFCFDAETMIAFEKAALTDVFLDFHQIPRLEVKGPLLFSDEGGTFEKTVKPFVLGHIDVRTMKRESGSQESCLHSFLNTTYLMSLRWPPQKMGISLLNNGSEMIKFPRGSRFGKVCDLWWFSSDRHSLYAVFLKSSQNSLYGRWPPRDDDTYRDCPVGVLRNAFPLVHPHIEEILPKNLCSDLLAIRKNPSISQREHEFMEYIKVRPTPPDQTERLVAFKCLRSENEVLKKLCADDELESKEKDREYIRIWDLIICDADEKKQRLWSWVYFMGFPRPILFMDCCCCFKKGCSSPKIIDMTQLVTGLVRMRELGVDGRWSPEKILETCLDIVLSCCPSEWRARAKEEVTICPLARRLFLSAKGCHYFLQAVPMAMRKMLDLTHVSGLDLPCKWDVYPPKGPRRNVMWLQGDGTWKPSSPVMRFSVKNTKFSREVRNSLGLDSLEDVNWADLKMHELLLLRGQEVGKGFKEIPEPEIPCSLPAVREEEEEALQQTRAQTEMAKEMEKDPGDPLDFSVPPEDILKQSIEKKNQEAREKRKERRKGSVVYAFLDKKSNLKGNPLASQESISTVSEDKPKNTPGKKLSRVRVQTCLKKDDNDRGFLRDSQMVMDFVKKQCDDGDLFPEKTPQVSVSKSLRGTVRCMKKALRREERVREKDAVSKLFGV